MARGGSQRQESFAPGGAMAEVRPSSPPGGQALPATHQSLYLVRTTTGEAM